MRETIIVGLDYHVKIKKIVVFIAFLVAYFRPENHIPVVHKPYLGAPHLLVWGIFFLK